MADHLTEGDVADRIAQRVGDYLHIARRMVVDQFGSEAGPDQVIAITNVAQMMATLEHAEIVASSFDRMSAKLAKEAP